MYIGTIKVDDYVNTLVVTRYARNLVKNTNLLGDRTIDRGKLKYKLDFKLNLLTNAEWKPLLDLLLQSSVSITFFDASEGEITREFSIDSVPSPRFIVAGDTTYYKDITLSLEEL